MDSLPPAQIASPFRRRRDFGTPAAAPVCQVVPVLPLGYRSRWVSLLMRCDEPGYIALSVQGVIRRSMVAAPYAVMGMCIAFGKKPQLTALLLCLEAVVHLFSEIP